MKCSRRNFLGTCAGAGAGTLWGLGAVPSFGAPGTASAAAKARTFHASISIDAFKADPELPDALCTAGVSDVWVACFFHGNWHHPIEEVIEWRDRLRAKGLGVHNITIPLGHPSFDETVPDYMPQDAKATWKRGVRPDGRTFSGVSIHPPATAQNVDAVSRIKTTDPGIIFVDDDYRLAPSPNDIGGCFCDEHRKAFLEKHGYGDAQWDELLQNISTRTLSPVLKAWLEDTCDELTACFRAQQKAAAPEAEMGIMVMYLGSEKAGIRLADYAGVPFRVGELMFNDDSFAPVKGKTNELFSALFHRRFITPQQAFSETTAWPPDKLSAPNMAAKLIISTIADVRNTMFMSGTTPFPRTHWEVLGPAMRKQAQLHEKLAGHVPRGPFKHFWGEHSRWVGDANPFSLFMATGVPFEVTPELANDGWTFLADADARGLGAASSPGTTLLSRPEAKTGRPMAEDLDALFAFKHEIAADLAEVPHVEQDLPIVCAWYPTAGAALLWNLSEKAVDVTLRQGETRQNVSLAALDAEILPV